MLSIDVLKSLTALAQLDFHSACDKAAQLLTPWPLNACRIEYVDCDHQLQILGDAGAIPAALQPLASMADGQMQLLGEPAEFPLNAEAQALLDAVSQHLDTANRRYLIESHLQHQVNHDPLTGLANRQFFTRQLHRQLARNKPLTVLFVDLDDFKQINDRFGHSAADHFLKTQAARITTVVGEAAIVGRLGGDEFALVLTQRSAKAIDNLAAQLCQALSSPVKWHHHRLQGHVSVGVADSAPDQTLSAEQLLIQANHAMFRAKQRPGSTWHGFDAELEQELENQQWLLIELEQALVNNELDLHYQPIIDAAEGCTRGLEALLRWHHPQRGVISPGEFISLAEESGLIIQLDHWVLDKACRQLRRWLNQGFDFKMTVNVSSRHFSDPAFANHVGQLVSRYRLPRHSLLIELTEHALLTHFDTARQVIQQLSASGIRLALDDFGTGFSSLSYLKNFQTDKIKIDREFIRDLESDPSDAEIVKATIALGRALEVTTLAEGVETTAQANFLTDNGCDQAQGFLFGRPMPAHEIETVLKKGHPER